MKSFFAGMTLARAIIVLSVIGSAVLGYTGWKNQAQLAQFEAALKTDVPKLVTEIQQTTAKHFRLKRDLDGDQLVREDSPESYILSIAARREVELGNIDYKPRVVNNIPGVIDYRHRVQPKDRTRAYSLGTIGNFLFYLEDRSRSIKVTDIKINLKDGRVKPDQVPLDEWTFDVELTSREKAPTKS